MVDDSRYVRQVALPEVGVEGQRRLGASRVVVMGCGALGAAAANLLARAGVGRLVLVDRDFVERSDLQRQALYDEDDVAADLPKAEAARRKLARANPDIAIDAVVADVDRGRVEPLVAGADLVVDGADNFDLRFLVNEACVKAGVPWVHGAVLGSYGVQWTVVPGETACLACLVDKAPAAGVVPTCETAGVMSPAVAAVAALQVAEALKLLTGNRHRLRGTLVAFDLWANTRSEVRVARFTGDPGCPVCVEGRFDRLEGRVGLSTSVLCGRDVVQVSSPPGTAVPLAAVAARLPPATRPTFNAFLLRFEVDGCRVTLFPDGRAIVQGTADPARARAILAKHVGL